MENSMPTHIRREALAQGATTEHVQALIKLRVDAGAIRAWREGNELLSEWPVFGISADQSKTVIRRERLEQGISAEHVQALIELRVDAGAIRAWREGNELLSEWPVFGISAVQLKRVIKRERLEQGISAEHVQALIKLRVDAGAIRAWREGNELLSEWLVHG
jgi:hypothetical protein